VSGSSIVRKSFGHWHAWGWPEYSRSGDTGKAGPAWQDFLTLSKDADLDIPILKQAEAEYAKLQELCALLRHGNPADTETWNSSPA
jgi:hypothetical protein